MRYAKLAFLVAGSLLFGLILYRTDLTEVWAGLRQVGWWGIIVIFLIHQLAFMADAAAWQGMLPKLPATLRWYYRLWKVRMIGTAFNIITPLASMGGEPVKVALLKKQHGVGYLDGTTSLVLEHTINTVALVVFLMAGLAIMLDTENLPPSYRLAATAGLVLFATAIALFFLVQRFKVFSRAGTRVTRGWAGVRLATFFARVHDVEERLNEFYSGHRGRVAWTSVLTFASWVLGAVEVYYALAFLGHPVTFAEAWVIEAAAMLVRSVMFFIPASLGTQEGAFVLVTAAITGSPALGLAVALLRRFREIVWVGWGLGLGWSYPATAAAIKPDAE